MDPGRAAVEPAGAAVEPGAAAVPGAGVEGDVWPGVPGEVCGEVLIPVPLFGDVVVPRCAAVLGAEVCAIIHDADSSRTVKIMVLAFMNPPMRIAWSKRPLVECMSRWLGRTSGRIRKS